MGTEAVALEEIRAIKRAMGQYCRRLAMRRVLERRKGTGEAPQGHSAGEPPQESLSRQ